jgi:pimeloyl-ACP methyl ester carboxylesterase
MRARLFGSLLLTVVTGACGTVAPSIVPVPSTPAPTVSTSSRPALSVPPPGTSSPIDLDAELDVGGRTMRLVCVGPTVVGEPTILLEAGLGDDHHTWDDVARGMESEHRLCAYDRAGLGHSESRTERSVTAADHVADLRALLEAANLDGPFVIGAHSYGAAVAILFTQAYPEDVAGLLFVDPRSPRTSARFRAALPDVTDDEPDGLVQLRYSLEDFETDPLLNRENLDLRHSFEEAAAALDTPGRSFGDRPVVVLSAGASLGTQLGLPPDLAATFDGIWTATHEELADESTAGALEVVPGAGHYIHREQPRAVIDALERILDDLRTR